MQCVSGLNVCLLSKNLEKGKMETEFMTIKLILFTKDTWVPWHFHPLVYKTDTMHKTLRVYKKIKNAQSFCYGSN